MFASIYGNKVLRKLKRVVCLILFIVHDETRLSFVILRTPFDNLVLFVILTSTDS